MSMGFSRQVYWSGLLCPSSGDRPNPGIEPRSSALQADSLPVELPGKPLFNDKRMFMLFILIFENTVKMKNGMLLMTQSMNSVHFKMQFVLFCPSFLRIMSFSAMYWEDNQEACFLKQCISLTPLFWNGNCNIQKYFLLKLVLFSLLKTENSV